METNSIHRCLLRRQISPGASNAKSKKRPGLLQAQHTHRLRTLVSFSLSKRASLKASTLITRILQSRQIITDDDGGGGGSGAKSPTMVPGESVCSSED